MNNFQLDQAGEAFIKSFEGLRLEAYQDGAGVWTIGWGHTQDVTQASPAISLLEAEAFFQADLAPAVTAVNKLVTVLVNQNQGNALCDFVFNLGEKRLFNSTLLVKLNRGDIPGAAKEFLRWVFVENPVTQKAEMSPGLARRRQAEMKLFLTELEDGLGQETSELTIV